MTVHYIGIGGPMGSGKNYLATQLKEELENRSYTVQELAYGTALKNEANLIIKDLYKTTDFPDIIILAGKYKIYTEDLIHLYTIVQKAKNNNTLITGWTRTNETREILQYLGTEIRRKANPNYWVDELAKQTQPYTDFVIIPDLRFFNEADFVKNNKGHIFDIRIPLNVIQKRLKTRDGVNYSEASLAHSSEIGLSKYSHINFVVPEKYDTKDFINKILDEIQ